MLRVRVLLIQSRLSCWFSVPLRVFKFTFCKYFFRGKCTRGSTCTFAHGVEELRERPQLSKTRICEKWRQGACEHINPENCRFAHGKDDLRIAKPGICDLHRQGEDRNV